MGLPRPRLLVLATLVASGCVDLTSPTTLDEPPPAEKWDGGRPRVEASSRPLGDAASADLPQAPDLAAGSEAPRGAPDAAAGEDRTTDISRGPSPDAAPAAPEVRGEPVDVPPAAERPGGEAGPASVCAEKPPPALLGHWKLDETTGLVAGDSSCSQLPGRLMGYSTPDWRPGRIGGALGLDGARQWVSVADLGDRLDAVATSNKLTVALWVRLSAVPGNQWTIFVQRQRSAEPIGEHFSLGLNFAKVGFGNAHDGCYGPDLVAGAWYHLAGTFDGAAHAGALYVNGVQSCSFSSNDNFIADTTPVTIGAGANGTDPNTVNEWTSGLIDEVLLYTRALTSTEIASLAAAGAAPRR